MKKGFDRDLILGLLGTKAVIKASMVETDRWSVLYELIVCIDGNYWRFYYNAPATEYQEVDPFAGNLTATGELMHEVTRSMSVWEPVPDLAGNEVLPCSPSARSYCAVGAILAATSTTQRGPEEIEGLCK